MEEVWRKPDKFLRVLSQKSHTTHAQFLQHQMWQAGRNVVYQGSSLQIWCPRFLLGPHYIGTFSQHVPKFQTAREKQVLSIIHILYTKHLGIADHPYQLGNGGKTPQIKFPDASQGSILHAGLSEDRRRPTMWILFCIYSHFQFQLSTLSKILGPHLRFLWLMSARLFLWNLSANISRTEVIISPQTLLHSLFLSCQCLSHLPVLPRQQGLIPFPCVEVR